MAKFMGLLGVVKDQKEKIIDGVPSGIFENQIEESLVCGDVLQNIWRNDQAEKINDDLSINNRFSVIVPDYMIGALNGNDVTALYLKYHGAYWKITQYTITPPRMIFTVGGKYNGVTAESAT